MTVERSDGDLRNQRSETRTLADADEGEMLADRSAKNAEETEVFAKQTRKAAALTPQIRDRIAIQLRTMYESVSTQPVPDRFSDLIAKLDSSDREQG